MTDIAINRFPPRFQTQVAAIDSSTDSSGSINNENEILQAVGLLIPGVDVDKEDAEKILQCLLASNDFEKTRELFLQIDDQFKGTYQHRQLFNYLPEAYQLLVENDVTPSLLMEVVNIAGRWAVSVYHFMDRTFNFIKENDLEHDKERIILALAQIASYTELDSNFTFSKYYQTYPVLKELTDDPVELMIMAARSAEGGTGTAFMAVQQTVPQLDGLLISREKQLELISAYFEYGEGFPDTLTSIIGAYRFLCLEFSEPQAFDMLVAWLRSCKGYTHIIFENLMDSFQTAHGYLNKYEIVKLMDLFALESSENQKYYHLYLPQILTNLDEVFNPQGSVELLSIIERFTDISTRNSAAVLFRLADIDRLLTEYDLSLLQLFNSRDDFHQNLLTAILSIDAERFREDQYIQLLRTRLTYEIEGEIPAKTLLAVFGTNDRTGVFQIDKIKQMFSDYYANGYQILYFEKSFDHEYIQLLTKLLSRDMVFADKIIAGHGDQDILALGGDNPIDGTKKSEEYFIDLENDPGKFTGLDSDILLREDGKILCISCKTGKGKAEEDNIANFLSALFQRQVMAPVMPTNVEKVIFDDQHNFVGIEWTMGIENYLSINYLTLPDN